MLVVPKQETHIIIFIPKKHNKTPTSGGNVLIFVMYFFLLFPFNIQNMEYQKYKDFYFIQQNKKSLSFCELKNTFDGKEKNAKKKT